MFAGVMGCGAAEATGLGFVCFAAINPRVLSANRDDLGFLFLKFTTFFIPPTSAPPLVLFLFSSLTFVHFSSRCS